MTNMIRRVVEVSCKFRDKIFPTNGGQFSDEQGSKCTLLFFLTILFYISLQMLEQASWLIRGEMWAEMATNYFVNAQSSSYFVNFFSTDSGYIPIPQRIIAFIGNGLHMPAAVIPYFYTWSGIIMTAILVGSFCSSYFSSLIKSDVLRFLVAISILTICDFETKTFINFTYFSAFFIAIITALALVDRSREVPRWSWFVPIFMMSKPAVVSVLPMMLLTAIVSKNRFRWITLVSAILAIFQVLQVVESHKNGVFLAVSVETSVFSKMLVSFEYFFGLLGKYFIGRFLELNKYLAMVIGVMITIGVILVCKKKHNSMALAIVGLSMVFFNTVINCFAISDQWNSDMWHLDQLSIFRSVIIVFFGVVLILVSMLEAFSSRGSLKPFPNFYQRNSAIFLFAIWLICAGWLKYAIKIGKLPSSTMLDNSQWQRMSTAIDAKVDRLCVPIDPINWVYSRNCDLFSKITSWEKVIKLENNQSFDVIISKDHLDKISISAVALVRPTSGQKTLINAKLIMILADGVTKIYSGLADIKSTGGLILLTGNDEVTMRDVSSAKILFDAPVEIAVETKSQNEVYGVFWMGY